MHLSSPPASLTRFAHNDKVSFVTDLDDTLLLGGNNPDRFKKVHENQADFFYRNPQLELVINTGLNPNRFVQFQDAFRTPDGNYPLVHKFYEGSGKNLYSSKEGLPLPDFINKLIIPKVIDTKYSTWPSEKISDTLVAYFEEEGDRVKPKDWPDGLPAHSDNHCFRLASKDKTKEYYVGIGPGQEVAIIIPHRKGHKAVLTGDDSIALHRESEQEMIKIATDAFHALTKKVKRDDYDDPLIYEGHNGDPCYFHLLSIQKKGASKGHATATTVKGKKFKASIVGADGLNDKTMVDKPHYETEGGLLLPNNVVFMEPNPKIKATVSEWEKENPNIHYTTNLMTGIQTVLRGLGISYKE